MHGRTQRRQLPHRTVAEILAVDRSRLEDERYCGARHQHLEIDGSADARSTDPIPGFDRWVAVEKGDCLTRRVTRGRDSQGSQGATRNVGWNALERDSPGEQAPQRRCI